MSERMFFTHIRELWCILIGHVERGKLRESTRLITGSTGGYLYNSRWCERCEQWLEPVE